jgi:oligopeptide transport system substrate-binding protein
MVTYPQRQDIVEAHGDKWTEPENIVTNGPFLLAAWEHEYKLELVANERHFEGKPALDRVMMYVVEERTTALTLYETGELELIELPPVAIPHYRHHPEFAKTPQLRGYYYGFNVKKPPFDDVRVRQAFAHSIDRAQLPRILNGEEIPTSSWIPKGMFGYNPAIGLKFDPEKALRLLDEAGYPKGQGLPMVTATYNTQNRNRLIAEFLQGQWKEHLGISVALESMEWKVFLSQLDTDPPQMFRLGWGADFPDPENFMNLFIATSGNNRLQWANRQYDELVDRGPAITDPKERQELYDQAQRILTETDAAMIPLFISMQNMLIKPYVKGLELNSMEMLYLKRIHLDKAAS